MSEKYRILYVEDVVTDAELVERELKKNKIDFDYKVVDKKEEFINALHHFTPDVILCDHSLPQFNSEEALTILKSEKVRVPFIIITATISEEVAIDVVRKGADDYILKDRLKRLPSAVINAIEKFRFEKELTQLIDDTEEKEAQAQQLRNELSSKLLLATKVAGIGIWEYNAFSKSFTGDKVLFSLYGTTTKDLQCSYEMWMNCIHNDDREKVHKQFSQALLTQSEFEMEFRIVWPDQTVHVIKSLSLVQRDTSGNPFRIVGTNQDVTAAKVAEQVVKESEAKYKSFFETSIDGILLTTTDGRIHAANPAACAIFQMSEEEIIKTGRPGVVDLTDPRLEALLLERKQTGKAKGELRFKRKDGTTFPVEVTSTVYIDAFGIERTSMIFRDVTERKQAEQKQLETAKALQQAVKDVEKIMDSSLDIICTINEEGRFVSVSSAAERIWGYAPSHLLGKMYYDYVFEEDLEKTAIVAKQIIKGEPVTIFENRYISKDGRIIPMLWSARWEEQDKMIYCIAKDATEKKRLEAAFESERQRFYEMFLNAPCSLGIFKGPDHVFEMANDEYLNLSGRTNIVGKPVREVFPEVESQGLFELLDSVYKTGVPIVANERLVKVQKNGEDTLTDVYLNFVYQAYRNKENEIEGVFFFAIDISEQVFSRRKIEESEKRFRQIVETAQEGIWMMDENNKTMFINQKMCDLLEYREDEIIGKTNLDFKDEEGQQQTIQRLSKRKEVTSETHESKFFTKSGKQIFTIVSTNPIYNDEGEFKGSLAMVTDITTRKQQELQIAKQSEERELLIKELTKSIKDLKQFSYITSHNFRAPLSNLVGLLTVIDYENLNSNNREIIEMFKTTTNQLNKTINDLIQILIIRNNVNVNKADNDLNEIINEVSSSLAHEISEADCTIIKDLHVQNIVFNRSYLESILVNLLSNAIKYRYPNRPLIININTRYNENNEVVLTVEDNGLGINMKRHGDSIFGLYQRFHSNADSAGLGLFIVKSQITALGGTIDVQSEENKGTAFYITFK